MREEQFAVTDKPAHGVFTEDDIAFDFWCGARRTDKQVSAVGYYRTEELYFELRCIHPTTGDARSFWSKVGDKHTLTNALDRATALNLEGYGLYFAPCLRSQKQRRCCIVVAVEIDPERGQQRRCFGEIARRE